MSDIVRSRQINPQVLRYILRWASDATQLEAS